MGRKFAREAIGRILAEENMAGSKKITLAAMD